MVNLDIAELRSKIDLEGKYVDFSLLRTALTMAKIVRDLDLDMTEPTKEGECRGKCPKCDKDRSFCLNINNNRFNCFAKGCILKGGGVIDFFAKLYEVPAKEASHLLACVYGIQPYTQEPVTASTVIAPKLDQQKAKPEKSQIERPKKSREVSRVEFDELQRKFERLSVVVWSLVCEKGDFDDPLELLYEPADYELEQIAST